MSVSQSSRSAPAQLSPKVVGAGELLSKVEVKVESDSIETDSPCEFCKVVKISHLKSKSFVAYSYVAKEVPIDAIWVSCTNCHACTRVFVSVEPVENGDHYSLVKFTGSQEVDNNSTQKVDFVVDTNCKQYRASYPRVQVNKGEPESINISPENIESINRRAITKVTDTQIADNFAETRHLISRYLRTNRFYSEPSPVHSIYDIDRQVNLVHKGLNKFSFRHRKVNFFGYRERCKQAENPIDTYFMNKFACYDYKERKLSSTIFYLDPVEVIAHLNELIHRSKTKYRQFISNRMYTTAARIVEGCLEADPLFLDTESNMIQPYHVPSTADFELFERRPFYYALKSTRHHSQLEPVTTVTIFSFEMLADLLQFDTGDKRVDFVLMVPGVNDFVKSNDNAKLRMELINSYPPKPTPSFFDVQEVHDRIVRMQVNSPDVHDVWRYTFNCLSSDDLFRVAEATREVIKSFTDVNVNDFVFNIYTLQLEEDNAKAARRNYLHWSFPAPSFEEVLANLKYHESWLGADLEIGENSRQLVQNMLSQLEAFNNTLSKFTEGLLSNKAQLLGAIRRTLIATVTNLFIMVRAQDDPAVIISAYINIVNSLPDYIINDLVGALYTALTDFGKWALNRSRPHHEYDLKKEEDTRPAENFICTLAKVIASYFSKNSVNDMKDQNVRVQHILNVIRMSRFSKDTVSLITEVVTQVTQIISVLRFGSVDVDEYYKTLHIDLPRFLHAVTRFEISVDDTGKIFSPHIELDQQSVKVEILRIHQLGNKIAKELALRCIDPRAKNAFAYFVARQRVLTKIVEVTGASILGQQVKNEPYTFYCHGKPGTGKSHMIDFFLGHVYASLGEKYDRNIDKYSKPETTTFWDGYCRQKVYSINDFLQTQEEKSRQVMLAEFIQMGDRSPYSLDMAHIENKGNTFFNSEIVAISAQERWPAHVLSKLIQCPAAFERRVAVFIEVLPNEDYLQGKSIRALGKPFDTNACKYNAEFRGGKSLHGITYEELVFEVALDLFHHRQHQSVLNNAQVNNEDEWRTKFLLIQKATQEKEDEPLLNVPKQEVGIFDLITKSFSKSVAAVQNKSVLEHSVNLIAKPFTVKRPELTSEQYDEMEKLDTYEGEYAPTGELDFVEFYMQRKQNLRLLPVLRASKRIEDYLFSDFKPSKIEEALDKEDFEKWCNNLSRDKPNFYPRTPKYFREMYRILEHSIAIRNIYEHERTFTAMQSELARVNHLLNDKEYLDWKKIVAAIVSAIAIYKIGSALRRIYNNHRKQDKAENSISAVNKSGLEVFIEDISLRKKNKPLFEDDTTEFKASEAIFGSGDERTNKPVAKRPRKGRRVEADLSTTDLREMLLKLNIEYSCPECKRNWLIAQENMTEEQKNCPYYDCTKYLGEQIVENVKTYHLTRKELVEEIIHNNDYGVGRHEAARDPCLLDVLGVLRKNVCRVKNSVGHTLQGIFIGSQILIFPNHLYNGVESREKEVITIESDTLLNYKFSLSKFPHFVDDKVDVVFVQLTDLQPYRKIVKFFLKESDVADAYDEGYLLRIHDANTATYVNVAEFETQREVKYWALPGSGDSEMSIQDHAVTYRSNTVAGDCGAPVCISDRMMPRKIIGFHIIGDIGNGWCNILSQEYIYSVFKKYFPKLLGVQEVNVKVGKTDPAVTYSSNVDILGTVGNRVTPFMPTTTKIVESAIHGQITEPTTKPSLLSRRIVDPMALGLAKGFTPDIHLDRDIVDLAVRDLVSTINAYHSSFKLRNPVLTHHEMINGIPGSIIRRIDLSTSAGYPYCLNGTKTEYLSGTHPIYQMGELLERAVAEREKLLSNNTIPSFVVLDTLKDERRPIDKVREGKTRVFSCGPLDLTLLVRKYYMVAMAHLMENCVKGEVSVGINPHSEQWGAMLLSLESKGSNWIAGDYGAYDKRMPYQVLMAVAEVVNGFCNDSDENQRIRRNLMTAMASAVHLCGNTLYRIHHGMPSGVPITAVGNSIANSLLFRIAFLYIGYKQVGHAKTNYLFEHFTELVGFKSYGDDHLATVSDSIPWFNMNTISDFFKSIGIEYTDATKRPVTLDYIPFEEVQYLKRKFVTRNSTVFAPLDKNSINEMLNWITKGQPKKEATKVNCTVALLEMTHYPREEWEKFYNAMREACLVSGVRVPTLNYETAMNVLRNGTFSTEYLSDIVMNRISTMKDVSGPFNEKFERRSFEVEVGRNLATKEKRRYKYNVPVEFTPLRLPCHQARIDDVRKALELKQWNDFLDQNMHLIQQNWPLPSTPVEGNEYEDEDMPHYGEHPIEGLAEEYDGIPVPPSAYDDEPYEDNYDLSDIEDEMLSISPGVVRQPGRNGELKGFRFDDVSVLPECVIYKNTEHSTQSVGVYIRTSDASITYYNKNKYWINSHGEFVTREVEIVPYGVSSQPLPNGGIDYLRFDDRRFYVYEVIYNCSPDCNNVGMIFDSKAMILCYYDLTEYVKNRDYYKNHYLRNYKGTAVCRAMGTALCVGTPVDVAETGLKEATIQLPRVQMNASIPNTIEDADAEPVHSEEGITKFTETGAPIQVRPTNTPIGRELSVYGTPSLLEYLERPYLIKTITWTSTSDGMVDSLCFPHMLFKVKSLWNKMQTFKYFRGDIELELRVNATSFHYGKMMVATAPYPFNGAYYPNTTLALDDDRYNVWSMSSLSHVFVSPTSSQVVKLNLPFSIPQGVFDLTGWNQSSNVYLPGIISNVVYFVVLAPLRANTSTVPDVDISVFARFRNVMIQGFSDIEVDYARTTDPVTPSPFKTFSNIIGYNGMNGGFFVKTAPATLPRVQSAEASEKTQNNDVSLAPLVNTVGTVLKSANTIAEIAGAVGFADKPLTVCTDQSVQLSYSNFTHSRGLETGRNLGIDQTNSIGDAYEWMGGTKQETELVNIASRYALLLTGSIAAADVAGTRYFSMPVSPVCRPYTNYTSTKAYSAVIHHSPLSYVVFPFRYWRGTMRYKLQVVASKFHSMRLRIAWNPEVTSSRTATNLLQAESNIISQVFDVKDDTEVEFKVPFLFRKPLIYTHAYQSVGFISLTLVNSMTHPTSPVPDVTFLLWHAACDDLQVYRYDQQYVSCYGMSTTYGDEYKSNRDQDSKDDSENMSNQSQDSKYDSDISDTFQQLNLPRVQVRAHIDLGTIPTPFVSSNAAMLKNIVCGEDVVTVYDLMKRTGLCYNLSNYFTSATSTPAAFDISDLWWAGNRDQSTSNYKTGHALCYWTKPFRFWRGSFHVKIMKYSDKISYVIQNGFAVAGARSRSDVNENIQSGTHLVPGHQFYPVEATIPFYCDWFCLPTNTSSISGTQISYDTMPMVNIMAVGDFTGYGDELYACAGDDYQVGGWTGVPYASYKNALLSLTPR